MAPNLRFLALLVLAAACSKSELGNQIAGQDASRVHGEQRSLGAFAVESEGIAVGDPCYPPPSPGDERRLHGLARKAKLGDWQAIAIRVDAGGWGQRCAELVAHHVDHPLGKDDKWSKASEIIGVDSGQAGIFALKTMGLDSGVPVGYFGREGPLDPDQLWYSMCCKVTLTELEAGVIPGGAVSSSGFGDGAYEWFTRELPDGSVVAVRIVFLTDEDLK
jgi:hypothetical protein